MYRVSDTQRQSEVDALEQFYRDVRRSQIRSTAMAWAPAVILCVVAAVVLADGTGLIDSVLTAMGVR